MAFELRGRAWLNKDEVLRRVNAAAQPRLLKCGALVEAEAKLLLNKGATKITGRERNAKGQFKTDGKPAQWQTNAAPGEPPNKRTGNLQNSIQHAASGPGKVVVGPTTTAWYGRVMEFGAKIAVTSKMRGFLKWAFGWDVRKSSIYIPPRPFMRPALERCRDKFPEQFRDLPLGGNV